MLSMAECGKEMALQDQFNVGLYGSKNCWVIMENGDGDHDDDDETYSPTTTCSSSSSIGNCTTSAGSSLDVVDDDASSSHSNGPLYELSELMAHLPIKRGLSKYFQGKSQSFTSLSKAVSVLDLAKKENPYTSRRKMKSCSSYGGGLDAHKLFTLPKPTISKKTSRRPFSSRGRSS